MVSNVSSQVEASIDTKPLLVDCTASCFKSKESYFSTQKEKQPWILFDFQQMRIMFGIRAFLRVDGGARDLSTRQSRLSTLIKKHLFTLCIRYRIPLRM